MSKDFREYVVALHQCVDDSCARISGTRKIWTDCFPGWDADKKKYDPETWLYRGHAEKQLEAAGHRAAGGGHGKDRGGEAPRRGKYTSQDPTLQHPRCVFQVLKRHFSRYTPEMVERYCGVPKEAVSASGGDVLLGVGTGKDGGDLLRGGMDAAFQWRADHSRGGDSAIAAGKYRAAGRRDSGAARACVDSGIDGYSDAL